MKSRLVATSDGQLIYASSDCSCDLRAIMMHCKVLYSTALLPYAHMSFELRAKVKCSTTTKHWHSCAQCRGGFPPDHQINTRAKPEKDKGRRGEHRHLQCAYEAGLGAPKQLHASDLLEVRALTVADAHLEASQVLLRARGNRPIATWQSRLQ